MQKISPYLLHHLEMCVCVCVVVGIEQRASFLLDQYSNTQLKYYSLETILN